MDKLKPVSAPPHVKGAMSTARIMQLVLFALLPASVFGVYNFGMRALLHIIVCVVTCMLAEFTFEAFANRPLAVADCSAAVTGLLLALSLPVSAPLWLGALGSVFAIVVVKMLFGGIGQNIVNPALTARCFLLISFAGHMTNYTCDSYSGATPLAMLDKGVELDLLKLILGNTNGCIGETSTVAILAGAILLLALGIINLRIPASFFLTFTFLLSLFGGRGFSQEYLVSELCGGGLMLAVWFMASDYTTSPITKRGQILYGILIGALTVLFRLAGGAAEGISYAILLGNLTVPLIEKITVPRAFGKKKK